MGRKVATKPEAQTPQPSGDIEWGHRFKEHVTACKHGIGNCEVCGTSERVDRPHTTVGGKGLVARLREKK